MSGTPEDEREQTSANPSHATQSLGPDASSPPNESSMTRTEALELCWKILQRAPPKKKPKIDSNPEPPLQSGRIDNPPVLDIQDSGYLCKICRHIDFSYLIKSPLQQVMKEIPLACLEWIFMSKNCAFCCLVSQIIQSALEKYHPAPLVNAASVTCTLQTVPMDTDWFGARELVIYLSENIVDFQDTRFYHFTPAPNGGVRHGGRAIKLQSIDHQLARSWYMNCLEGKCGSKRIPARTGSLPNGFRVIDVQRSCIVEAEPTCHYVALSYVWGGAEGLENSQQNRISLEKEGVLQEKAYEIPNTIKDAIELTASMGLRYLWVDRLCIVQDDRNDTACQIAAMDQIYSLASLTIAAVSGDCANSGLSGSTTRPRLYSQPIAQVQGMDLAHRPRAFEGAVNQSVWNSRAWTFQERVMSYRTLFIAEQRCFYACQCRSDVFVEGLDVIENGSGRKLDGRVELDGPMGNLMPSSKSINILTYGRLVRAYTSRRLSYPTDILNAFKGIEALLHPLFRSDFLYGLPRSEIDSQLLWQPEYSLTRRRDLVSGLPMFPSWSWAGWVGQVECNRFETVSRIEWVEASGEHFTAQQFCYPVTATTDIEKRLDFRLEWRSGLDKESGLPYYFEKHNPDDWFLHPTAAEEVRNTGPNVEDKIDHIVFEAETTGNFNIHLVHYMPMYRRASRRCTEESHELCPLGVLTPEGHLAGYLQIPGEIFNRFRNDLENGTWPSDTYDFILISRGKLSVQEDRGEVNPESMIDAEAITMEKAYFADRPQDSGLQGLGFDQQRYDAKKPWCIYNVMLVEIKDRIAYRLGVGKIHIDAWARTYRYTFPCYNDLFVTN